MKSEPASDQIDIADHIATIIFTFLGLVVLNLYPNLFAVRYPSDGTWVTLLILTESFFQFLPWINIMGLLQILFSGFMLSQKAWITSTRILGILMDIAGMVLAVVIMRTPEIFNITPASLASIGMAESAEELSRLFSFLPTLIIVIVVVVTSIKVIKTMFRLFSGNPRPPYPVSK